MIDDTATRMPREVCLVQSLDTHSTTMYVDKPDDAHVGYVLAMETVCANGQPKREIVQVVGRIDDGITIQRAQALTRSYRWEAGHRLFIIGVVATRD